MFEWQKINLITLYLNATCNATVLFQQFVYLHNNRMHFRQINTNQKKKKNCAILSTGMQFLKRTLLVLLFGTSIHHDILFRKYDSHINSISQEKELTTKFICCQFFCWYPLNKMITTYIQWIQTILNYLTVRSINKFFLKSQ